MKGGIFITSRDIQILMDCSPRTAERYSSLIKQYYEKTHGKISIRDFADYFGLEVSEVTEYLIQYR